NHASHRGYAERNRRFVCAVGGAGFALMIHARFSKPSVPSRVKKRAGMRLLIFSLVWTWSAPAATVPGDPHLTGVRWSRACAGLLASVWETLPRIGNRPVQVDSLLATVDATLSRFNTEAIEYPSPFSY